ncbi:MAG: ribosome-associated translation inhibitor RaiA [Ignavibacteriales bacterium]|nr:ribosome-associated translation inhibitor RaiA [Ignavibacteriales bacterium]
MNIQITARKFKAHDTLKEYIKDEVSSLERFNDEIIDADVILSFQNNQNSLKEAEIILNIPGQTLTATDQTEDFKTSVTSATEKLRRQLETIKSKKKPQKQDDTN